MWMIRAVGRAAVVSVLMVLALACGQDRVEGPAMACSVANSFQYPLSVMSGPEFTQAEFVDTAEGQVLEVFFVGGPGEPEGAMYTDADGFTVIGSRVLGYQGNAPTASFSLEGDRINGWDGCQPVMVDGDLVANRFRVESGLEPESTTLLLLVQGGACVTQGGGQELADRIARVDVEEAADEVSIAAWTEPTDRFRLGCAGVGIFHEYRVDLDTPLADRKVLDTGLIPGVTVHEPQLAPPDEGVEAQIELAYQTGVNHTGLAQDNPAAWYELALLACSTDVWDPDVLDELAGDFIVQQDAAEITTVQRVAQTIWLVAVGHCRERFPEEAITVGPPGVHQRPPPDTVELRCDSSGGSATDLWSEPPLWSQSSLYLRWTDAAGCAVRVDVISHIHLAEHCDWQEAQAITIGRPLGASIAGGFNEETTDRFIWDPGNAVGTGLGRETMSRADLAPSAIDTGFRRNTAEMWLDSNEPSAIFVVKGDVVEIWERSSAGICY